MKVKKEMKLYCKVLLGILQIIPLTCLLYVLDIFNTFVMLVLCIIVYLMMFILCGWMLKKSGQNAEDALNGKYELSDREEENTTLSENNKSFGTEQAYMYREVYENSSKFLVESSDVQFEMPKKVLIVDDSMQHLKLISSFLRKMNIDASMAQSGNEAIATVQRERFALILMDHMMKGKDGIETVKEIRQLKGDYYKEVPIVDVLSRGMEQYEMKVNSEYYQACLTKPIDYELLQQVMMTYGLYQMEDAVS